MKFQSFLGVTDSNVHYPFYAAT